MTTETGAPAAENTAAPAIQDDGVSELTLEDARALIDAMPGEDEPPKKEQSAAKPEEQEAPAEQESSKEDSDPETDPAEQTQDKDQEEKLPPIERPRSWAKELDEEWASYPRTAQERIAKRETERDTALRRSQNEAAETRKAIDAERQQLEQSRKQYEARLPALEQALLDIQFSQFPDIKTMADVERMAQEDPFRKIQWDTHQQKLQAIAFEKRQAEERQAKESSDSWQKLISDENAKFIELVPEFADEAKAKELTTRAVEKLNDLGFTKSELAELAAGKKQLPIYDHRIQQLIVDSLKLTDIQNAPKAVAAKPLPPVQKPGVPRGNANDTNIQALERKLASSGSEADGWALLQAKLARSDRSRRAS